MTCSVLIIVIVAIELFQLIALGDVDNRMYIVFMIVLFIDIVNDLIRYKKKKDLEKQDQTQAQD